jgi:hypothetical protein
VLFLAAPLVGAILGVLAGGSFANWQRIPLRWPWVILVILLVRLTAGYTPIASFAIVRYVYVVCLVAFIAWMLVQVRALPALAICALGIALNVVVIVANNAHMPVSPSSGFTPSHAGGTYVIADSTTKLNWLGDWIGLPGWLGGAISPGDLVVVLGIGVVSFGITKRLRPATKLDTNSPELKGRESPP